MPKDMFDRAMAIGETMAAARNPHAAERLVNELESLRAELDEALIEIESVKLNRELHKLSKEKTERERDEAREDFERSDEWRRSWQEKFEQAERERDEARARHCGWKVGIGEATCWLGRDNLCEFCATHMEAQQRTEELAQAAAALESVRFRILRAQDQRLGMNVNRLQGVQEFNRILAELCNEARAAAKGD